MKIEKLLTLSQFVDEIKQLFRKDGISSASALFPHVEDYNNFLKQPLTKEMFVNPFGSEPQNNYMSNQTWNYYQERLLEWQEAEKKVIFECVEDDVSNFCFGHKKFDSQWLLSNGMKLSSLAEITNGELTLKNIEL